MRPNYKFPPKPIDNPDFISVLIPTRGRVESLKRVFSSFAAMTKMKELIDLWLYVDEDDIQTIDYINSGEWQSHALAINWHVGACTSSMGEMFNMLWQASTSNAGIYFPFPDDYLIRTYNWDGILRKSFSCYSDGMMLGFIPDPSAMPYQVTFWIPSARWLNTLGYMITNRFYFWFDDIWLDEIANMARRKVMIPISLEAPAGKGKTPRMRNLPFWYSYFRSNLKERFAEASKILSVIHADNPADLSKAIQYAELITCILFAASNSKDDESLKRDELLYGDVETIPSPAQVLRYLQAELLAVEDILVMLTSAISNDDIIEAQNLLSVLSKASLHFPDISYIKSMCINRLGLPLEALKCLEEEVVCSMPDAKVVRLAKLLVHQIQTSVQVETSIPRASLYAPSWLQMNNVASIFFTETIYDELFFILQKLVNDNSSEISSVLDIGAGDGTGATEAILRATSLGEERLVFCIEPDPTKGDLLLSRHAERVHLFRGGSIALSMYKSVKEIEYFYRFVPSVMNFISLHEIIENRERELHTLNQENGIDFYKSFLTRPVFDLVIIDGSQFCGESDLDHTYGAKFIALNGIKTLKNYANFNRLSQDTAYDLLYSDIDKGSGYALFKSNLQLTQ